ncbi:hypothetical protein E2562_039137 [Oryza meyeriana var. granulata]|uniref:Uncharacterized protein n=1 Tax=Oryza meyeriana var. granulata TaxID=110450 RepID=A0A6G1CWH8_9ORYZ|nr:hypothetical protein E2562_039137 [Oryza meyeriana var. granulata]
MGRPPTPSTAGPGFRFMQAEVAEMEALLPQLNNAILNASVIQALADKFTASSAHAGSVGVPPKQSGWQLAMVMPWLAQQWCSYGCDN